MKYKPNFLPNEVCLDDQHFSSNSNSVLFYNWSTKCNINSVFSLYHITILLPCHHYIDMSVVPAPVKDKAGKKRNWLHAMHEEGMIM